MFLHRLIVSCGLIATLAVSAKAADLPSRIPAAAPTLVSPVFSWSGFYAGGNIGKGWKRTGSIYPLQTEFFLGSPYLTGPVVVDTSPSSATVGGVQAGYDHQIGSWVLGVQASVDATRMNVVGAIPTDSHEKLSFKTKLSGSFTGRVGYALQPELLAYAKGGIGWSRAHYSDFDLTNNPPYWADGTATHWGWVLGAGLEYALTSNWSTFIEYSHADYGSKNVTLTNAAQQNSWSYKNSPRMDTVMLGVNYRFGK